MKLLLDTHIFLWYITDDAHLSPGVADAIEDESNDVYLSVVSVWESARQASTRKAADAIAGG